MISQAAEYRPMPEIKSVRNLSDENKWPEPKYNMNNRIRARGQLKNDDRGQHRAQKPSRTDHRRRKKIAPCEQVKTGNGGNG